MSPALAEVWDTFTTSWCVVHTAQCVSVRPHLTRVNGHIYTVMMGFVSTRRETSDVSRSVLSATLHPTTFDFAVVKISLLL